MIAQAKKIVVVGVMALAAVVISLPAFSLAATAPTVSVLSPLVEGVRTPIGISLDADGNIYVADPRSGGIVKLDAYGTMRGVISTSADPNGLAFALDGTLLVSQGASVVRYDVATGQEIGRLVGGNLRVPAGIAVDNVLGTIYVADTFANQVVKYSAAGDYLASFAQGVTANADGTVASNPVGKLSGPTGIAFEKISRQVVVADSRSKRVQFFDVDGRYIKSIGKPVADPMSPTSTTLTIASIGTLQFEAPSAVFFEYSKNLVPAVLSRIYVVDTFQGKIQVIDPSTSTDPLAGLQTTSYVGSKGLMSGQLFNPSGAVFDSVNNRVIVASASGVVVYGIDGGANPLDPKLTLNPVAASVSVPGITIGGTNEVGAVVTVAAGSSAVVGPVEHLSSTAWRCNITNLTLGSNVLEVSAAIGAGNPSRQFATVLYLMPAPVVEVTSLVPSLTNVKMLELKGNVSEGATVSVINGSVLVGEAAVVGAGWSVSLPLEEGANKITIAVQKALSFKAPDLLLSTITLDSIAPALVVSSLSDGSYTSTRVQNVAGKVVDTNAVTVLVNNIPAVLDAKGAYTAAVTLVDGKNSITVEARDLAGNVTLATRTLFFDETKPQITIVTPMDNSYTNNPTMQVEGTVSEAAAILVAGMPVLLDGANHWVATVALNAGLNTIEVVATDLTGNTSSLKRSVELDTSNPVLAISYPAQDIAQNLSSISIVGTVADVNLKTVMYSVDGKTATASVNPETGSFTFKANFVNEGVYPVKVTAVDAAGNSTAATRTLIYDTTPPLLTLTASKWQANAHGGKLSGTVEPGSSVVVKEGDKIIGSVVIDGNKWSADLSGISYNQSKLTVIATDAAGNTTSKALKADGQENGKVK